MSKLKETNKRKKEGIIISDKGNKSVVVLVKSIRRHPLYKKQFKVYKRYYAHDEKNIFKEGDTVIIEETRPISMLKRWKVIEKIEKMSNKNKTIS